MLLDRPVDLWSIARMLDGDRLALLENPLAPSRLGRMSYLGLFPQEELRVGHEVDPATALTALAHFTRPRESELDSAAAFASGVIGYLAYELLHGIEPSVERSAAGPPLGELLHFVRYGAVIAVDAARGTTEISSVDPQLREAALELALAAPDRRELPIPPRPEGGFGIEHLRACGLVPVTPPDKYRRMVEVAREQIAAGRLFEVCLSQEFRGASGASGASGAELFARLREANPAPMGAYLRAGSLEILCSSPERLVGVTAAGEIETRPIKGTRPRTSDRATDRHLAEALAASSKDRAENTMIVDVARNDLGRICLTGSVEVPELCIVESYASVHHLVSTVRGQLAPGVAPADVIAACFPGGSMTGAPKVEAMRAIAEAEHSRRGIFSGAIGWIGDDGAMDLNIVIRTLVKQGEQLSLHTGGAVTYDSDPAAEYSETLDKARAVAESLAAVTVPVTG
jgi:anthranilate/para-aminobenzoate synthase component I